MPLNNNVDVAALPSKPEVVAVSALFAKVPSTLKVYPFTAKRLLAKLLIVIL